MFILHVARLRRMGIKLAFRHSKHAHHEIGIPKPSSSSTIPLCIFPCVQTTISRQISIMKTSTITSHRLSIFLGVVYSSFLNKCQSRQHFQARLTPATLISTPHDKSLEPQILEASSRIYTFSYSLTRVSDHNFQEQRHNTKMHQRSAHIIAALRIYDVHSTAQNCVRRTWNVCAM